MSWIKRLGPGILFAGAAIGVSHLVQATKAGASFGFDLIWAVLIANIVKYPFFGIASDYTAHTGTSVLAGYKRLGKWSLWLVIALTVATMFIIQAAVTLVTEGLAQRLFGTTWPLGYWSVIILGACALLVLAGKYTLLDHIVKIMVLILSLCTVVAMCSAWNVTHFQAEPTFAWDNSVHLVFLVSLLGWMPAPLDCSIWTSLWAMEKKKSLDGAYTPAAARLDFRVGQIITTLLALCFVALGAFVMYGSGQAPEAKAAAFAGQLIQMYTSSLGSWAWPIIATAAFLAMFSTTLTCLDAFPRVIISALGEIRDDPEFTCHKTHRIISVATIAGALGIIFFLVKNMGALITVATFVSFCTTPIVAALNCALLREKNFREARGTSPMFIGMISIFFAILLSFTIYYLATLV